MFQTNLILKDVAQKDITLGSQDIAISAVFVTCMQCSAEEMSSGIGYSSRWMCRGNQMVLGVCFHPPKCLSEMSTIFDVGGFQGVCKGEGESGVSGGFHGLEGAAETGEGADWVRGLDLQVLGSC